MGRGARGVTGRNATKGHHKKLTLVKSNKPRSYRRVPTGVTVFPKLRRRALELTETARFRAFVLCVILLNSLTLCLPDPVCKLCLDEESESRVSCVAPAVNGTSTWKYRIASYSVVHGNGTWAPCTESAIQMLDFTDMLEYGFTAIFTLELIIQVTAKGLIFGKKAYLRDIWNWLDFIVVVMSYASVVGGMDNVSSVRTFRVLRPLRTLTTIPGMKVLVTSLMASVPAMFNVVLMSLLMFFVLGVVGIQLWGGMLSTRCFMQQVPDAELAEAFAMVGASTVGAPELISQVTNVFNQSMAYELDALDSGACAREDLSLAFGRTCGPGVYSKSWVWLFLLGHSIDEPTSCRGAEDKYICRKPIAILSNTLY
jgi:hypothetical protein